MNTPTSLPNTLAIENQENLKLWLCELTHLTPNQVERLIDQMAQQQAQSGERVIAQVG